MNSWFLLNSGKCEAAYNMALDEALLETVASLGRPALRFYGWTEPAATFGYFQRYADVERGIRLRPLVRRPTAGGIVPHDRDWTYSLVFPPGHDWYALRAEASYRRVHEWIQAAFRLLRVPTELAPHSTVHDPRSAKGCFVGHEKFDLLWHGRKIAGAAQRRNRLGLLIQGSVQSPEISLSRPDWENAMRESVPVSGGVEWLELAPDSDLRGRTGTLVREKYSQQEFITRR